MTNTITDIKRPVNVHKTYHAHVYFDSDTKEIARGVCDKIAQQFDLKIGRFHERLVGPHPRWSCQVTFRAKHFDEFIPWLDANREGLTIFIHGLTGDYLKDHTDYAYWLEQSVELNLEMFQPNRIRRFAQNLNII